MKKSGDDNIFVDDGEEWEEDAPIEENDEEKDEAFLGDDEEEE